MSAKRVTKKLARRRPKLPRGDRDVTFHNLSITLTANSAKDAYDRLTRLLDVDGLEYNTDTYEDHASGQEGSTEELFPQGDT